jgi:hypothetical protein
MCWSVEIDGERDRELCRKVRHAEAIWRGLTGESADRIDVPWRLVEEQGPRGPRPLLLMSVEDRAEGLAVMDQKFEPDELKSGFHMRNRLNSIWGELLLSGARAHLCRVHEIMSPYSGD